MNTRSLLFLSTVVLLSGCDAPQNLMQAVGPAAQFLASLGWFVLLLFCGVTFVMYALILWVATRRRGTFSEHAHVDLDNGQHWILIGGFAVPVAVLSVVFISSLQAIGEFPLDPGIQSPDIRVVGQQWWFEAQYPLPGGLGFVSSPTELHMPTGQAVDIELVSRDVIHSFWVPKLHGKVDLVPGQSNYIRLRVDEPGVYHGQCGEFCGLQHAHMRIQVVAQTPAEYQAWLENQQHPARNPGSEQARYGKEVFMQAACPLCHTVRGTLANGHRGPDLTHLGSRTRIAGGMLKNNKANLSAWITRPQSFKPGAKMPDITAFSGRELQALTAYLQSLQ